jgi:hypothetical protein
MRLRHEMVVALGCAAACFLIIAIKLALGP